MLSREPFKNIEEIREELRSKGLRGWKITRGRVRSIVKRYRFKDFVEAVNFIERVKDIAEEMEHHPDICIFNYNNVKVSLTTHDAGGVTQWDIELALKIEELYRSIKTSSKL
ncbi:MAG: 4a-hydroxytetrahydrobiopterin dehydratase [Desulfurococcaceae archaeon]|nr:MAG: 4a-hydroxytetrahydrobiopterin dehydratase [Desulfurococcaceae archaeon]